MPKYSTQPLTPAELLLLRKQVRGGYFLIAGVLVSCILLGLLLTNIGKMRHDETFVWMVIGLFGVLVTGLALVRIKRVQRDEVLLVKICGEFPVEKVMEAKRYNTYLFLKVVLEGRAHQLRVKQDVYDRIVPGDMIYVEFVPNSNTLLRLVHEGKEMSVELH